MLHVQSKVRRQTCERTGCETRRFAIPDQLLLSVVIPVYNERATLIKTLERVRRVPIRKEIVLVDDGSTDGSRGLLRGMQAAADDDLLNEIRFAFHERNRGKGSALRTGFSHISGDIVLIQDADLEYDPAEYPRLIQPILDGKADVVYGSRFLGQRGGQEHFARRTAQPEPVPDVSKRRPSCCGGHYLGNRVLTGLSNLFTKLKLTDMETCYKVFRRDVLDELVPTLKQNRFGIEPEVTAKLSRRNARVVEVPIRYSARGRRHGKKIRWRDGVNAIWCIFRYGIAD